METTLASCLNLPDHFTSSLDRSHGAARRWNSRCPNHDTGRSDCRACRLSCTQCSIGNAGGADYLLERCVDGLRIVLNSPENRNSWKNRPFRYLREGSWGGK